ncbi:uncharacterized protein [Montipora capricornis]|uniref:uncharacterized protein n=1 Tax=Montipora capricornis TaxID=246305 RepID=UPI0035F1E0F6
MAEAASRTCELDGEETKLLTWSTKSTKLLISLRRENDDLFSKGKIRKNVAWQRIAEKFNLTSSVNSGEQCSNKWKKLEKYKKVKEHNDKMGNDRKECDFQEELEEFFGTDPRIIPTATVSSLTAKLATGNTSTDDEEESPLASCREPPKKKKKRRSKSSATEMIEFLTEYKEEKQKEEEAKIVLAQKMHNEKLGIMERFLDVLSKKAN